MLQILAPIYQIGVRFLGHFCKRGLRMATAGSPYRETVPHGTVREQERRAEMAMGGSLVAGACGIGRIILAILGLANLAPVTLRGISTIVVGAALLAEEAAIAAKNTVHLE